MGADHQEAVILQGGELLCREHALVASGRVSLDPGRRVAKTAGRDKEGGRDVAQLQVGQRVFENTYEAVIEGNGAVARSGRREGREVCGGGLGEPNQEVHLTGEASPLSPRDGVVIEDD